MFEKLLPREGWRKGDEGPFSMIAPKAKHLFLHPFDPRQGTEVGGRCRTLHSGCGSRIFCDTKAYLRPWPGVAPWLLGNYSCQDHSIFWPPLCTNADEAHGTQVAPTRTEFLLLTVPRCRLPGLSWIRWRACWLSSPLCILASLAGRLLPE